MYRKIWDAHLVHQARGEPSLIYIDRHVLHELHAPHAFKNASGQPARLLCMCSPSGQEEFFLEVGQTVGSRTEPPPELGDAEQAAFIAKSRALAPQYRTELLPPPGR